ncbi:MAG: polysaccharide deacetylase family protein [Kofleriaceae bacterium]
MAELLHRAGALGAIMHVRRFAPFAVVPIVTYHHVSADDPSYPYDPDTADATPEQFRRQLETIVRHTTPIGVDDLVGAVEGKPLPTNAVMITFDDGYRSCHDVALPILKELGVRATFFVSTRFITERTLYWWERISLMVRQATRSGVITYPQRIELDPRNPSARRVLNETIKNTAHLDVDQFLTQIANALGVEWNPSIEASHANQLIMTWDHVRALSAAGMDIESHTRNHRVLQTLDRDGLRAELEGSRKDIEAEIGRPVRAIAYPVGRRVHRHAQIRKALIDAGYQIGLSNVSGVNRLWPLSLRNVRPVDPFDLRRLATDRGMSDAMYFTQFALPGLAYVHEQNKD